MNIPYEYACSMISAGWILQKMICKHCYELRAGYKACCNPWDDSYWLPRVLAHALSQDFPFREIFACWLSVVHEHLSSQSFAHANFVEKTLLGVMHIPTQIHVFFLWVHVVVHRCHQHENLWVIVSNNGYNIVLCSAQESHTHMFI